MNKNDLINQINTIKNAKRVYRNAATDFVIHQPETFSFLLELIFKNQSKTAIKSAWVLELVCQKNILLIKEHLDFFINNINTITDESALRPISKTCSFIVNAYQNNKLELTNNQKEIIIETNFDWVITKHKVATKVFAMETLYLLGKEYNWVHTELKLILEKNTSTESAAYQSRSKKILKQLNNNH